MKSVEDLVVLLRDELGLPVTLDDIGCDLDQIPGWDSVHLLWLSTILEQRTGHRISLPEVLEAPSLERIYAIAMGG